MSLLRLSLILLLLSLLPAANGAAQCVSSSRADGAYVGYDAVQLVASGIPGGLMDEFRAGFGAWNNHECNGINGDHFPSFTESPAGRVVTVTLVPGFNPNNSTACGEFAGNNINIFESARLPDGSPKRCDRSDVFTDNVTHELGHLLGLQDQYDGPCSGFIMSQAGFTTSGSYIDRRPRSEECLKVAITNVTPQEEMIEECENDPTNCPQCDPQVVGCGTPIILDLDGRGFAFTSQEGGTLFDIDADGVPESTPWTSPRGRDVFLVFDRNHNGLIDDGSELFGDRTPFLNGTLAQNGYQVLFELDIVMGNGNGYIDAGDTPFEDLKVWHDRNKNGAAEKNELFSLAGAGILKISVNYRVSLRRDEHGNELRFVSHAYVEEPGTGTRTKIETTDVVFPYSELGAAPP